MRSTGLITLLFDFALADGSLPAVLHLLLRYRVCRFELAIQLGDLETAAEIANTLDTPAKWRQLGE
jgi:hypothetical protein